MGGKSRKSGGVSRRLIEKLQREKSPEGQAEKKKKGKKPNGKSSSGGSLFELPEKGWD